jgi:hypothetical protein
MSKDFMARVFLPNPGGAYDPAPLNAFDAYDGGFSPAVGDVIRSGLDCYRVVSRYFDADANRLAIFVEHWIGDWPEYV